LISAPFLADNRSVAQEGRALLESNPSACAMAGQYPERLSREALQSQIIEKWVLACPKAINSSEREAARSASKQMPWSFRKDRLLIEWYAAFRSLIISLFKLLRTQIAQWRVQPDSIVIAFDVREGLRSRLLDIGKRAIFEQLRFVARKEALVA
jgi:hypothetical protein